MPSEEESVLTIVNPAHGMEEEMKIEAFLPMNKIPTVTAQEKGVNFKARKFYTKPEVEATARLYRLLLLPYKPTEPLKGAIALRVSFRFPLSKGHYEGQYKTTKPDTDNMLKLLKDVMSNGRKGVGFWEDDAQVAYEVVKKTYSKDSGIFISVEKILD